MINICYFGSYRNYYPRNILLINALKKAGLDVYECHVELFPATYNKIKKIFSLSFILLNSPKIILAYVKLIYKYLKIKKHKIIVVGYFGYIDIWAAKLLSIIYKRALVFDAFISLYDTIVNDRKIVEKKSLMAKIIFYYEKLVYNLSNLILIDTKENADYIINTFNVSANKIVPVLLTVFEEIYYPRICEYSKTSFVIIHYSYYAPLHGVEYIIDAANYLKNYKDICFILIGDGQERPYIEKKVKIYKLSSITFFPIISEKELAEKIAISDICLGVFGGTEKVKRVIPNKILQAVAMKKPLITAYSNAVERYFKHKQHLLFCRPQSGEAIAECIMQLKNSEELRNYISQNGYLKFKEIFSIDNISFQLFTLLKSYF
jgi:glycosyltransferase involved in cell wall biosynthesis